MLIFTYIDKSITGCLSSAWATRIGIEGGGSDDVVSFSVKFDIVTISKEIKKIKGDVGGRTHVRTGGGRVGTH